MAGHLFLVFIDDTGNEFVVRGGPTGDAPDYGNMILQIDMPLQQSADAHGEGTTPADYGRTLLDLADRQATDVWSLIVGYAREIALAALPYEPFTFNSNSVVANLLYLVGVDVDEVTPNPSGVTLASFCGTDQKFNLDVAVQGTDGKDIILGSEGDEAFVGGAGNDSLSGSTGADQLLGGDIVNPDTDDVFKMFDSISDASELQTDPAESGFVFAAQSSGYLGETQVIQSLFAVELWAEQEYRANFEYFSVRVTPTRTELFPDEAYGGLRWSPSQMAYVPFSETDAEVQEMVGIAQGDAATHFAEVGTEPERVQEASDVPACTFFVVGGKFDGTALADDGTLTGSVPDPAPLTDWLLAA